MKMRPLLQYIGLALLTLFVVPVVYVSIAASVDMQYDALGVTFSQAFDRATSTPLTTVIQDDYANRFLWFIPFAIIVCLASIRLREHRASNYILLAGALVPAVLYPLSLVVSVNLPLYLVSPHDGETWGEAWPALSAIGFWVVVAFLLGVYRWRTWSGASTDFQTG